MDPNNAPPDRNPPSEREAYDALQAYTLSHGHPDFIHQHVVDAWMAQHADERTKPIGLTFALVGLYLHVEEGFTGRQVQRAHMALARRKEDWPRFALPAERGKVTASRVVAAPPGPERDRMIHSWCASVWEAYSANRAAVDAMLRRRGIL